MQRESNTEYILSLSYGKDSIACLEAIRQLNYPIDRIVHAEIWATDTIPADLPPMVEFKAKADKIIMERYGITVEHICAVDKETAKITYENQFYHKPIRKPDNKMPDGSIQGFPLIGGRSWCNGALKGKAIKQCLKKSPNNSTYVVKYLGIALDEPERICRHSSEGKLLPLVAIGWTESDCRKWCEDNDLLSPIYTDSLRGGCWFCPNQSVNQLRTLRRDYPDYWALMLKWDDDSPTTFKPDGRTVHDFDARFALEDEGIISPCDKWRWSYLHEPIQLKII